MAEDEQTDDTMLLLADALVATIAQNFPTVTFGGKEYPVAVKWCEDANIELEDKAIEAPLVWVLDAADLAASESHLAYEDFDLLIVIQMKIPAGCDQAAFARAMANLTAKIRSWARNRDTSAQLAIGDEGFPCVRAERQVARNHEDWHNKRRFYAEILTKWRRF